MADEKIPLSSSKTVNDWVAGYYSIDTFDYGKKDKIKHVGHVAQFASICYVISKNSKKAHVDLFEANYTASSTFVDRAASLIVGLLELQTHDSGHHVITQSEFNTLAGACGLHEFVGKAQIFHDYTDADGLVNVCKTLFPIRTDSSKNQAMFEDLGKDLDEVRKDHAQLRQNTNPGNISMKYEDIMGMRYKIAEVGSKKWNEIKSEKSKGQFELSDAKEAFRENERDLAFKTGKVAVLGGAAAMSVGAVIGGTFWPALLLLPIYSLGKRALPDFFKSLGKAWGGLEKQRELKRQINRASAKLEYLQLWATYGNERDVNKHLSFRYKLMLNSIDRACFKKQGKQMQEAVSTEIFETDADGNIIKDDKGKPKMKFVKGKSEERFDALSKGLSVLQDAMEIENLAPADAKDFILDKVKALSPDSATYGDFINIADNYDRLKGKLPPDTDLQFRNLYAEKLKECAKHLIFQTKLESLTDPTDKSSKYLAEDSKIMTLIKDVRPDIVEDMKRYLSLAGKEVAYITDDYVTAGKTLEDYIRRDIEDGKKVYTVASAELSLVPGTTKFNDPTHPCLMTAIAAIADLKVDDKDETRFVGNGLSIAQINEQIAHIGDAADTDKCNELLKTQMRNVSYARLRDLAKATYDSIVAGTFSGKLKFDEAFKKIGELTYENIDTYAGFYADTNKTEPKKAGAYIRYKFRVTVFEKMRDYAESHNFELKSDLTKLAEFLKKVNACTYLDENQKQQLSEKVKPFIKEALETTCLGVASNFGTFKADAWNGYIDNPYEANGFKTLFKSDSSSEIRGIENKMKFMSSLKDVQVSLNFGKYGMDTSDRDIISAILLRNNDGDFDKTIIREDDDVLLKFLQSGIRPTKNNELLTMDEMANPNANATVYNRSCYGEIEGKLAQIVGNRVKRDGSGKIEIDISGNVQHVALSGFTFEHADANDRYAALIALKTEFCREFETFLVKNLLKQSEGQSVNNWLSTVSGASAYWENIVNAWRPLAEEIDREIAAVLPDVKLRNKSTKSLSEFLSNYDIKDSSKVKETTRVREME